MKRADLKRRVLAAVWTEPSPTRREMRHARALGLGVAASWAELGLSIGTEAGTLHVMLVHVVPVLTAGVVGLLAGHALSDRRPPPLPPRREPPPHRLH